MVVAEFDPQLEDIILLGLIL
jgi:hypothetical protein